MNLQEAMKWAMEAADQEVSSLCDDDEFTWVYGNTNQEMRVIHRNGGEETFYQVIELEAITDEARQAPKQYVVKMTDSDGEIAIYVGNGLLINL